MADDAWGRREVLELDVSTATVWIEKPARTPRLGGRWLAFADSGEVWWELPDGGGFRRSLYALSAFPGIDFILAES